MSTTLPMKEVGNLISSPEFPNAVQWAADGTLAVAEGNGITLLNPSALNGPRSFCAVEAFAKDAVVEAAGGVLKTNQGSSIHHDLAMSSIILSSAGGKDTLGSESGGREKKDSNSQSKKSQVAPRAIAWSPPGAGPFGSSLLAAVLTDHRILVYGPQRGASPEWKELASLHDDVVNYMANESGVPPKNVRHVPSPAPSPSPDDPKTNHSQSQKAQPSDASDPENVESVQPRKPEVQVQVQEPEEEPTEQAGLAADPSPEPLTKQQAAMKTVSMFFTLRRNLPASEIPVYPTPSSHLKDGDLSCLKQAMDTVWTQHCSLSFRPAGVTRKMFEIESRYQLRLAWDRYNNVAREGYEEVVGLQGPGGSSCHPALDKIEKENGETTESEDEEIVVYARNTRNGRQRRQRASVQVPKRLISWLDLPPVNPQSAGDYKRTLINGAVKRFLLVRADGEEPAVRYRSSSQHLKAEDVALLEGVVEEYAEAFAEAFVALNLDKANFQQLVTVQLRKMWDRVTGKYIPPDLNIQETARDAFGSTVSNENDGPPVVPTLRGASHGLSGGGVRGRGGGRGKARGGGSQRTPFERGDQPANRLCTSAHEYERRLLSLSSISCAWSPILGEEVGLQCSLLAVGTKEGRVWLWRYCHGRNDARADEFDDHFNNRFTFLGCCCSSSLDASSGAEGLKPRESVPWSSALDWVGMTGEHGVKLESVILVIGRSDGSVALLMCKVDDLQIGNVQIDPNVFHQLDTVALGCKGETKVLQAVTCVCAKVVCGGTRLVVAVAGAMGIVSLWVGALKKSGQKCVLINQERVYSCPWLVESASIRYSAVTGLCMTCPPETDDDSWDLLILACNREGSLACWRLPCDRIQSMQGSESIDRCESPVACFKRVKPYREVGFGTFGIAASPGGGFIATARCALPKGIDIIK